jgi:hypothetical protein
VAEGVSTLPTGLPDLTLGWGVIRHASKYLVQPNGPRAGKLWTPTPGQARFLLWWYAVDEDGRWLFDHGVRRLAKGSGKSPFAGVMAIEELVGPVRLAGFDASARGGCVGKPVDMPLVQVAATAESQTENTMRMVRAFALRSGSRVVRRPRHWTSGLTMYYKTGGGKLAHPDVVGVALPRAAEATFVVERRAGALGARQRAVPSFAADAGPTTWPSRRSRMRWRPANSWEPGAGSVAETHPGTPGCCTGGGPHPRAEAEDPLRRPGGTPEHGCSPT